MTHTTAGTTRSLIEWDALPRINTANTDRGDVHIFNLAGNLVFTNASLIDSAAIAEYRHVPSLRHEAELRSDEASGQHIEEASGHRWKDGSAFGLGSHRLEVNKPRTEDCLGQPLQCPRCPLVPLDLIVKCTEE